MDPFFKHWKKNYRDINQLPYYAYLYQKEEVQFEPEVKGSSRYDVCIGVGGSWKRGCS